MNYTYTLAKINKIIEEGISFTLPENTKNIIMTLSNEVGSSTYIKTPVFQPKANNENKNWKSSSRKKNNEVTSNEEWERVQMNGSVFQTTKLISQDISEMDKKINQIRLEINKISVKTFSTISTLIVQLVDDLLEINDNEETIMKIVNVIVNIACNNKLNSKIYAEIYSKLELSYPGKFCPIISYKLVSYLDYFNNIIFIDPDVDYDGFCENNKKGDKQKGLSHFIVNLTLCNVIEKSVLFNIIETLVNKVMKLIYIEGHGKEVEEITENIIILFQKEWMNEFESSLIDKLNQLSSFKAKDFKSLSNKAIFIYMDILGK